MKKGDVFVCEVGDMIFVDGEIIEGLVFIDESVIIGEFVLVICEVGGDKSFVIGGIKVFLDYIKVLVI